MGICIAMLLGLPALLEKAAWTHEIFKVGLSLYVIITVAYLAWENLRWTMHNMKEQPTFKWAHKPGQFFVLLLAVFVIFSFLADAFVKLVLPWILAQLQV
ncbi:hypothetical protein KBY02_12130 [Pseudomonas sp. P129]|nr:hypothetical protein [Pseudomonas sp. P129]